MGCSWECSTGPQAWSCWIVGHPGPCCCCCWHGPEPCTTMADAPTLPCVSALTSSSLSWQVCFASLGGANREEDPNEELYCTWKHLGNCAREGSESFQLTVVLKSPHVLGLVLAAGCTMWVMQQCSVLLSNLFPLAEKRLPWRILLTFFPSYHTSLKTNGSERHSDKSFSVWLQDKRWVLLPFQA